MMKLLLACTVVLGLTGCKPTNPSYTDVNRNYSVRPENLKDCDISVIAGPGVNPITIARCPLSSTTTSQIRFWTVQDQKAGRLPEFLSFVYYEGENFEFVGVCVNEELWTLKCSDGKCIRVLKSKISPIESPDEKAKREEDEFVAENCPKDKPILCGTGFQIYERGFRDAFRKLKGLKQ